MPQQIRRLLLAFAIFIALFLVLRYLLVPKSFGEYGHYRGASLAENAAKPIHYAGTATCSRCHNDIVEEKSRGLHAGLACESCHGPAYRHVIFADTVPGSQLPDSLSLEKPSERNDCARCHDRNLARIKIKADTLDISMVRQVDVEEHNLINRSDSTELKCIDCHNPHDPF
jgi:hypothetical protein